MFLLVGCGRGAGPYVCIGWLWAIVSIVRVYVCMYVTICFHREGTCWHYISSSNKLKLKCTLSKLCVNDSYKAATLRLVVDSLAVGIKKFVIIVRRSGYLVGSRPIPMEPSAGHMIKYYKRILDIR